METPAVMFLEYAKSDEHQFEVKQKQGCECLGCYRRSSDQPEFIGLERRLMPSAVIGYIARSHRTVQRNRLA